MEGGPPFSRRRSPNRPNPNSMAAPPLRTTILNGISPLKSRQLKCVHTTAACGERSSRIVRCEAGEGDYPRVRVLGGSPSPRPSPRKSGARRKRYIVPLINGLVIPLLAELETRPWPQIKLTSSPSAAVFR